LFEGLATQDDHLMHIVGLERSRQGKKFFLVKNSWGEIGPYKGYIKVSEAYFAINTVTLVVPKAALDPSLKTKLGLK
jgi:bleomycin hydrolase